MAKSESPHLFNPEEVNALIPHMEEHFLNFWNFRENAQNILEELRKKARNSENLLPDEIAQTQLRQSQAHFLLEQGKKELEAIMELGGVIKDLETGLVDFAHILEFEEEEVYLCWKFGEKKVRFWHGLQEGYSARKPLVRKVHH